MIMLRCDESTFYVGVALLCGVVVSLVIVRVMLYFMGVIACRLTRVTYLPSSLERIVCVAVLLTAVVVLGDVSALTPWLVLLSTATSGACCWSRRSFRWIGVSSYVLYSLAVMHVVGPLFLEDVVELNGREWRPLMQGQRLLIPSGPSHATNELSAPHEPWPALRVHSFYRRVKIEGSASPLAASTSPAVSLKLRPDLQWWWARNPRRHGEDAARGKRRSRNEFTEPGRSQYLPTCHVIATGDATQLLHYTRGIDISAPLVEGSDSIVLLGRHGAIRHSAIHCIMPVEVLNPPSQSAAIMSSDPVVPCLRLQSSTQLQNVTFHWATSTFSYSAAPTSAAADGSASSPRSAQLAWQSLRVGSNFEQSCADVESQLQMSFGVSVASSLIECVDEVDIGKLPSSFVVQAPLLVWLGWQLPGYVRCIQDLLVLLSSYVAAFASVLTVEMFHVSCRLASALGQHGRVWLMEMTPYVRSGAAQATLFTRGVWCGTIAVPDVSVREGEADITLPQDLMNTATTPLARGIECVCSPVTHSAFRAGVHTGTSVAAVVSAAKDALDLVPGVWSMYAWAWKTEYHATLWITSMLTKVLGFFLGVAPRPIFRVLINTARRSATLAPRILMLLGDLWCGISQLRALTDLKRFGLFAWTLEKRLWCCEWTWLMRGLVFLLHMCEKVVHISVKGAFVGSRWGLTVVRHYNGSSFPTHVAVVFLQTTLLGIAMRNELNEVVVAEQQKQLPGRNVIARYMPTSVVEWLPLNSFANRVSIYLMLARVHFLACLRYLFLHAVASLVLIGLSVVPFASKLYALSLHYVFPWLSCRHFLLFFSHDVPPVRRIAVCFVGRMAVATVLQDTIGDLIYHVLKDALIALGLTGGLALLLWGWPKRAALAKQLATAISDSLQATPTSTSHMAKASASRSGAESAVGEKATGHEEVQQEDKYLVKKISFSDAVGSNVKPACVPLEKNDSQRGDRKE